MRSVWYRDVFCQVVTHGLAEWLRTMHVRDCCYQCKTPCKHFSPKVLTLLLPPVKVLAQDRKPALLISGSDRLDSQVQVVNGH